MGIFIITCRREVYGRETLGSNGQNTAQHATPNYSVAN